MKAHASKALQCQIVAALQRIMNPREAEFEKKTKLGAGSFGVVWLVQRRSDGEWFALKEIDLRKPGLQRVMEEVETMMKLPPDRNVVRLHEHWMSDDGKDMWLLLEYCSEGTLAQLLTASSRPDDAALWDLAGQLLQALLLFEQHRIVHNDIKPDNIFIMEGFIPKIGDLGMARFTSVGSVLSKTPGGTPAFQSPEVLSKDVSFVGPDGQPIFSPEFAKCKVSYQSDVYSLGAVLWSMIMRRNPDRPGGAFPLTPALVPDSRLRELINDMLQPDPSQRPRASLLVLRFTTPPNGTAPAPAPAIGSTVCIRRNDGSDSTLLRVRPTISRSDDAFLSPKVAITGDDRLQLLQTTLAEGSAFSLVMTSSGVQGYVQSKYIIVAPAFSPAPAPAPAPSPVFDPSKCVLLNGYYYKSLGDHDKDSEADIIEEGNLYDLASGWELCPLSPDAIQVCALHSWGADCLVFADGSVFATKKRRHHDAGPGSQLASRGLKFDSGRYGIDVDSAVATYTPFYLDWLWNANRSQLEGAGYTRASTERKHHEMMQSEHDQFLFEYSASNIFRECDVLIRRRAF